MGVEFPQTFSIILNDIWDLGLSNETELEGKTTADETLFRMEIDESSETKRNELINLEQLAINIGDANDDNVGHFINLFRNEFLNRGTRDLWKKCIKHLLQPIHIDGVKMMLELNQKHDYVEQCNLQATMLRMMYNDGNIIGSYDEFIEVVQLIDSYANARKPSNFEKN